MELFRIARAGRQHSSIGTTTARGARSNRRPSTTTPADHDPERDWANGHDLQVHDAATRRSWSPRRATGRPGRRRAR